MKKICKISGREFEITPAEIDFNKKISDINSNLGKIDVTSPICPTILTRNLTALGNLIHLFQSKSDFSGVKQISRYNPKYGYKICTPDEYWSDKVDNSVYGIPYDFKKDFFEQWNSLLKQSYLNPLTKINSENSDYVNGGGNHKNCYLIFASSHCEDCLYSLNLFNCTNCVDCIFCNNCQFCYECSDCTNCYQSSFCTESDTCVDCMACFDCRNCNDCIGCFGLERAKNCIFNRQVSEQEYKEFKNKFSSNSYQALKMIVDKAAKFSVAHKPNRILNSEDCSGAYIKNSSNIYYGYNVVESQDCGYLVGGNKAKDCWKGWFSGTELCSVGVYYSGNNCHFSYPCFNSDNCWYCFAINSCSNCFGCVSLKNKSYCILNKQYSKDEYFELVPRIIAQMQAGGLWAQGFPVKYAPCSYQESWVEEYFDDIPEETIKKLGYRWDPITDGNADKGVLSKDLKDVETKILDWKGPIICEESRRSFNLTKQELAFYHNQNLPLPRKHWILRLKNKTKKRERMPY